MDTLNRRSFLAGGAMLAGGVALTALAGCGQQGGSATQADATTNHTELPVDLNMADIEGSLVELEPLTDFAAEETYDVVVVGAGVAGVPAVLTAVEEGASVCCLQREPKPAANGYGQSAVYKAASTPGGIKRWMEDFAKGDGWRINRDLFQHHVDHSEETISWLVSEADAAGIEGIGYKTSGAVCYEDGPVAAIFEISAPEGGGNQLIMEALAKTAESLGAVFHYSTPAVQLIQDADGTVTGAIGKTADGKYLKVNATKGVILATGDYMNNDAMVDHYSRDLAGKYLLLQSNRTGDGHILGMLAGARIVPPAHAHQVHGLIPFFMKAPLIALDGNGERFMNENIYMTSWNTVASYHYPKGENTILYRFFDSEYESKYGAFGELQPIAPKAMLDNCIDTETPLSSYDFHNVAHRADTLEELCKEVGIPYESTKKSIDRYNELVDKGEDEDFGVQGKYLFKIEKGPFYCIKDVLGLAAINGGFTVNERYEAIDGDGNVIPHLYGAGVCADGICGGINWSMPGGCSNSHCISSGRYTALLALGKDAPSKPHSFDEMADRFRGEDGKFSWENGTARTAPDLW